MKQGKLNIESRRLEDLKPAEYNPRKTLTPEDPEYQKIKKSIQTFGYADPIIINKDGTIIGGHQRYNVLRDLGYEECTVVVLDLDKNKEKQLNIALNKITGEWDDQKLADLLQDLDLNDCDLSATGFDKKEIEDLYLSLDKDVEATEDDFDADEEYDSIEVPDTKRGDIWILGDHRLMCGDSTVQEDLNKLMDGAEADLVITDPPYNVDYGAKTEYLHRAGYGKEKDDNIKNDAMDSDSFHDFILDAFTATKEEMKPGAAIYVFHSDTYGHIFRNAFIEAGLKLSECLIWEKSSLVLGRSDYQWIHEPCLYGWKEGAPHYFIDDRKQTTVLIDDQVDLQAMTKAELIAYIEEIQKDYKNKTTVLFEKKPMRNDMHPTMKPIPLIGTFVKNSSKPGWSILDPFGGSGTTMMAAEELGRKSYTMELDPKFCDVIRKRWEAYTGNKATLYKGQDLSEVKL